MGADVASSCAPPTYAGLGLKGTRTLLNRINGDIYIQQFDDYKVIKIKIPLIKRPNWLFDIKEITSPVFILDDDKNIKKKLIDNGIFTSENETILYQDEEHFLKAAKEQQNMQRAG